MHKFHEQPRRYKQQSAVIQTSPAQSSQSIKITVGCSTTKVPVGNRPFKAFLDVQSISKTEEAAISSFTGGK